MTSRLTPARVSAAGIALALVAVALWWHPVVAGLCLLSAVIGAGAAGVAFAERADDGR